MLRQREDESPAGGDQHDGFSVAEMVANICCGSPGNQTRPGNRR